MALDWLPRYPDRLPQPSRRAVQTQIFTQPVLPIPNAAAPDRSLQGSYPDRISRRRLSPSALAGLFSPVYAPLVLFSRQADAIMPVWIPRRRLPVSQMVSPPYPFGVLSAIAISGGWRPSYPDWLRRSHISTVGNGYARQGSDPSRLGQTWLIDPLVLLDAAACVEWKDETLVRPTFTSETGVRPRLDSETCVRAMFTDEDLC